MARARNIKPGFFDNEELASMPHGARLLFVGLWTLADREGRLEDRPKKIRAMLFPYEREADVDEWLNALETSEERFIIRYEVEGKAFIQVRNFHKHQNPHHMEAPSEIPAADGVENRFNHKPISKVQRERIMKRDGLKCVSCSSTTKLAIDHVVPVSAGGSSDDSNLRVLCGSCNSKKGAKLITTGALVDDDLISTREYLEVKSTTVPYETLIPDSLSSDSLIPDSRIQAHGARIAPAPAAREIVSLGRFSDWWSIWSEVRGTANKQESVQAWLSVVTPDLVEPCIECTRSYVESLDDPRKGFNPDNFIFKQVKDKFEARWPKARDSPTTGRLSFTESVEKVMRERVAEGRPPL